MKQKLIWYLLLLIVVLLFLIYYKTGGGGKNAFVLLMRRPDIIWLNFINTFVNDYDVYVVIDDNTINIDDYNNITFLQLDNDTCKSNGYYNANYIFKKPVISWDKALYYFCKVFTKYNYVWFCEDDVYIPNVNAITSMDTKYNSDLLTSHVAITHDGTHGYIMPEQTVETGPWSHWSNAKDYFDLPWVRGMAYICRLSRPLLQKVNDFVDKHHTLEFIEILFTTLAFKNNLTIEQPIELNQTHCCNKIDISTSDPNVIYHNIKDFKEHETLRYASSNPI